MDNKGKEKEYVTQQEIVKVISDANKNKYKLCYNTLLLKPLMLSELGADGSGPAVQEILDKTYCPPNQ